nr:GTP cyclohydrolase I FolE [Rubrobacter taiwanensis]
MLEEELHVDFARIERAVREILLAIGEDPEREGLRDTPRRIARAYAFLFAGLAEDPRAHLSVGFQENHHEMVLVRDIPFYSMCEHHLMPFIGKAHVGYIPNGKVVGLSKLARVVEGYSRRPQLQERLTGQIADALYRGLDAQGTIAVVEAEHLCYDRETEILTRRGWVRFDEMDVEDEVAQVDPDSLRMSFVPPRNLVRYRYSGPMYRWRSDTVSLMVTPEHRMVYRAEWDLRWSVAPAYAMPPAFYVPQAVKWDAPDVRRVDFAGESVSGDDFAAFMGMWLSGGWMRSDERGVAVSRNAEGGTDEIRALLQRLPFGFRRAVCKDRSERVRFESGHRGLYEALRAFGKPEVRCVPDEIKGMSARQIELFLRWLAPGEGRIYMSGSCRLMDDVQELLLRVGETGALRICKDHARIEVRTRGERPEEDCGSWGRLRAEHLERVDFDDEVFCVSVPTGAVLVRREGLPVVSGNCMTMRGVQKPGSITVTSAVRGIYARDERSRQEAMALISRGR